MLGGFKAQDLDKVVATVTQQIQEELGTTGACKYQVAKPGEEGKGSAYWRDVKGGAPVVLCYIYYDFLEPRPTTLNVTVNKDWPGWWVGHLHYTTEISKKVESQIQLQDRSFFRKPTFTGDPIACEKLNSNTELLALANKVSRTKLDRGGSTLRIERMLGLIPKESGSSFVAASVCHGKVGIQEFFKLASMFEEIL